MNLVLDTEPPGDPSSWSLPLLFFSSATGSLRRSSTRRDRLRRRKKKARKRPKEPAHQQQSSILMYQSISMRHSIKNPNLLQWQWLPSSTHKIQPHLRTKPLQCTTNSDLPFYDDKKKRSSTLWLIWQKLKTVPSQAGSIWPAGECWQCHGCEKCQDEQGRNC